jgi:hypothetical protein
MKFPLTGGNRENGDWLEKTIRTAKYKEHANSGRSVAVSETSRSAHFNPKTAGLATRSD